MPKAASLPRNCPRFQTRPTTTASTFGSSCTPRGRASSTRWTSSPRRPTPSEGSPRARFADDVTGRRIISSGVGVPCALAAAS
eukprot:5624587-Pleurochrysis_carterae.AAC.5